MNDLQANRRRGVVSAADFQNSFRFDQSLGSFFKIIYFQLERAVKAINRRRPELNPSIICGFPLQQKARDEAPLP
ncbi:MAG TPA: hypothetical protein VIL74_11770 [Pyrinomonadaceae bacterium]